MKLGFPVSKLPFGLRITAVAAATLMMMHPAPEAEARSKAEVVARDLGRAMAGIKYCGLDVSRRNVLDRDFDRQIQGESESSRDYVNSQQVYMENVAKFERREPREGCEAVLNKWGSPEQQDIRRLNDRMRTLEDLTIQQLDIIKEQQEQLESR